MNRGELRKRIAYLLNEDPDDMVFFTSTQVNNVIQEAMEVIAEEVMDLKKQAFVVIEPGRMWYTLSEIAPDCMTPLRVWSEADETRLDVITMKELDDHRERWMEVFTDRPDWWYPISFDAFGIWPGPTSGGGVLRIDYVAWPETLLDDNDEPIFREPEQDLVVLYGMYDGLIRQWEPERALDIFVQFVSAWRDQDFKNATRRFHRHFFDRGSEEGSLPRI